MRCDLDPYTIVYIHIDIYRRRKTVCTYFSNHHITIAHAEIFSYSYIYICIYIA